MKLTTTPPTSASAPSLYTTVLARRVQIYDAPSAAAAVNDERCEFRPHGPKPERRVDDHRDCDCEGGGGEAGEDDGLEICAAGREEEADLRGEEEGDFGAENHACCDEEVDSAPDLGALGAGFGAGEGEEGARGFGGEEEGEGVGKGAGGVEGDVELRCLEEDVPGPYAFAEGFGEAAGVSEERESSEGAEDETRGLLGGGGDEGVEEELGVCEVEGGAEDGVSEGAGVAEDVGVEEGAGEVREEEGADEGPGDGAGEGDVVVGGADVGGEGGGCEGCAVDEDVVRGLEVEGFFDFGVGRGEEVEEDERGEEEGEGGLWGFLDAGLGGSQARPGLPNSELPIQNVGTEVPAS
ncbi:hypothetical protein V500_10411 [Pseudogymnoascus sp. VKM F-4518 (FW-2643)]|nr:hypothetical protein V500_10411 [Pseudogymnoascus sp. VKM F-4518 (FW-2643)]